jgi:hypothetical protein
MDLMLVNQSTTKGCVPEFLQSYIQLDLSWFVVVVAVVRNTNLKE